MGVDPFALYIHIPFCYHKCPYCDFNVHAVATFPEKEYVSAVLSELDYRASLPEWRGRSIASLFLGGGTPSLFSGESYETILRYLESTFSLDKNAEISLEANPGTVTLEKLRSFRSAGINRLSIGAQSFQASLLRSLGRMHSPEQIEAAFLEARESGFENVNLDLMYGAPQQTLQAFDQDITKALSLHPDHLSVYGLTIEKGTPFFQAQQRGALKLPEEEIVLEMMNLLEERLPNAGLEQYEISNFSRPGKRVVHNLTYWNGGDYLGIGAGAHSFLRAGGAAGHGRRWSNFTLPQRYIESSSSHGRAESWSEDLSLDAARFEFFFLGLRKIEGVFLPLYRERFGGPAFDLYNEVFDTLIAQGLAHINGDYLALTKRGIRLADSVIECFSHE
jgi:oxygen-independent coproporphyrinogen III oxidase